MTQKLKVSFSPERGVERVTAAWRREEDGYKARIALKRRRKGLLKMRKQMSGVGQAETEKTHLPETS